MREEKESKNQGGTGLFFGSWSLCLMIDEVRHVWGRWYRGMSDFGGADGLKSE